MEHEHVMVSAGANAFGLPTYACTDDGCDAIAFGSHPPTGLEQELCCRRYGDGCTCPCHADDFVPLTTELSRS